MLQTCYKGTANVDKHLHMKYQVLNRSLMPNIFLFFLID